MASILGAISSVSTLATTLFTYFTGDTTHKENKLVREAEHWQRELSQAIAGGDWAHASAALDQLRQLRDQAAASQHK